MTHIPRLHGPTLANVSFTAVPVEFVDDNSNVTTPCLEEKARRWQVYANNETLCLLRRKEDVLEMFQALERSVNFVVADITDPAVRRKFLAGLVRLQDPPVEHVQSPFYESTNEPSGVASHPDGLSQRGELLERKVSGFDPGAPEGDRSAVIIIDRGTLLPRYLTANAFDRLMRTGLIDHLEERFIRDPDGTIVAAECCIKRAQLPPELATPRGEPWDTAVIHREQITNLPPGVAIHVAMRLKARSAALNIAFPEDAE